MITASIFTKTVASGLGTHTLCLPPEANKDVLEFSAIGEGLSIIGIGAIKISMCLTLLRIVELAKRRIAQFLWCLLIFVVITHFGLGMMYFLHCIPLTAVWGPQSRASCLPTHTLNLAGYIIFVMDAVTDLTCAVIPILLVQRLQMDMRTKLALCGLMSLGIFTAGCAVAKLISLRRLRSEDYTWDLNIVAIWAAVEQFLGNIITSVPMLRSLFSRSHNSFHNWFRIRFSTPRFYFWGKSHSGSSSVELTQPKQQIDGPNLNLRDVEKSSVSPIACLGNSQADIYCACPIHSIVTDEELATKTIRDDFVE